MIPPLLLLAAVLMPLMPASGAASTAPTGRQHNVVFTNYSPLSRSEEIVRRLLTPLTARRLLRESQRPGHTLREQSLVVRQQKFAVYVPRRPPPRGYALLVFVPPWNRATVPQAWQAPLDRRGMIYVSAANSGNDANVLDRRVPLALLAAWNIMQRYRVDPRRVYIGGLSGGSRVAERIALGYPDLFRGALLIAGSDPIGTPALALPPAALFARFQQRTQLVYLTGQYDLVNLEMDARSRESMNNLCVVRVASVAEPWAGHELPDAAPLSRALDRLDQPMTVDANKLERCGEGLDKSLTAKLQHVGDLLAAQKVGAAQRRLNEIDATYGGMAAPQSIALARRMEAADSRP